MRKRSFRSQSCDDENRTIAGEALSIQVRDSHDQIRKTNLDVDSDKRVLSEAAKKDAFGEHISTKGVICSPDSFQPEASNFMKVTDPWASLLLHVQPGADVNTFQRDLYIEWCLSAGYQQ